MLSHLFADNFLASQPLRASKLVALPTYKRPHALLDQLVKELRIRACLTEEAHYTRHLYLSNSFFRCFSLSLKALEKPDIKSFLKKKTTYFFKLPAGLATGEARIIRRTNNCASFKLAFFKKDFKAPQSMQHKQKLQAN